MHAVNNARKPKLKETPTTNQITEILYYANVMTNESDSRAWAWRGGQNHKATKQ